MAFPISTAPSNDQDLPPPVAEAWTAATLRAKAQCDDLTRVAALSLTVDTTHMSASAVGQLVPSLRSLTLRGRVPTIRDLGTHFALLTTLHLPSCNLTDLDGIHAFPALIDLNVAHNRITDVSPLSLAESLVVLDVGHNKLSDWVQIEELALLATLRDLTLAGNPVVMATAAPRDRVLAILPHLRSLDGVAVTLTALYGGEPLAASRESNGAGAVGPTVTEPVPAPSQTAEFQRLALDRLLHAIAAPVSPTAIVAPVSFAAPAVRSTAAPISRTAAPAPAPSVGAPAARSSTEPIPPATTTAPAFPAAVPTSRSLDASLCTPAAASNLLSDYGMQALADDWQAQYRATLTAVVPWIPDTPAVRARARAMLAAVVAEQVAAWLDDVAARTADPREDEVALPTHLGSTARALALSPWAAPCAVPPATAQATLTPLFLGIAAAWRRMRNGGLVRSDLGTHFALLTTLHLPSCNLTDLDGIHAFPALIDLNVAHNRITDVSPLSLAESLVVLDVGHNKLSDWVQIEELALLATLRDLTLAGNPVVMATAAPRDRVLAILPHLRSLDGVAVTLTALYGGEPLAASRESNGAGAVDSPAVVAAAAATDSPTAASPAFPHAVGSRSVSPTLVAGMTRNARPGPSPPLPVPPLADGHAHGHGRRRHSVQVVAAAGVGEMDPGHGRARRVSLPPPPVDAADPWHGGRAAPVQVPRTASPPADDGASERALGAVRPGVLFTV
ncbi:hypothetical protein AMAG_13309 [Allomyces macrogynus ATCC 38327]|uniref:U2A'/phosphoprotein 32 family A C-terminal domain-containing protein n=1 Tax=Allomyces macrogynus (strain ATCC 38327) TaxID=578462 RepID=A0A0L0T047_ALLM3|nr:hypothetical protein AMAG_13309 [Allomyces macrogynus ATCC 38327]|eukprot:KNE68141.1 hypothetical protein AMAG_13309 [Allomyces macrogynus ATCC 38327]